MEKKLKEIWDNIRPAFAHVKEEDHITEESLFNGYRDNVIPHFDFKDTIVIDYGIGGGYLGKLLFEEYEILHDYFGRANDAMKRLKDLRYKISGQKIETESANVEEKKEKSIGSK